MEYDKLTNDLNSVLDNFVKKYIYDTFKLYCKSYVNIQSFKERYNKKIINDIIEFVLSDDYLKDTMNKFRKIYNVFYTTKYSINNIIERIVLFILHENYDEPITIFYSGSVNIYYLSQYNNILDELNSIYI